MENVACEYYDRPFIWVLPPEKGPFLVDPKVCAHPVIGMISIFMIPFEVHVYIMTCQVHPVLVKTGQMYGSFFLKNFLSVAIAKDP